MEKVHQIENRQLVKALPLMEEFYTIQGEGFHTGRPAYFIRLAGCDVGCVWCDVKESWDAEKHEVEWVDNMVGKAIESGSEIAVITGGEPAMYNLDYLTNTLDNAGMRAHIETSGVYQLTGNWHWICFSPKKFKKPHASIYSNADELKVIVYNKSDFEFAEEHANKVGKDCKLFLQPEWGKINLVLPLITAYVKKNPQWKISLQTHKYMGIP
ncbi:MAG: 7-carboxy-7-deazaguanine synthase QueE [Bacteroidota bacterium]